MDNSRIISSYKKRARDVSNSQPSGMVAKFRRFISPWTSEINNKVGNTDETMSNNTGNIPGNTSNYSINNTNATTTGNLSQPSVRNISIPGTFESPNRVISSFFQQKGEEPLTQVEYEGIVSLINKSRNFTPNTSHIDQNLKPNSGQMQTSSRKNSIQMQTSSRKNSIQHFGSRKPSISSELFNTPYTQKTIKANNSAIFSTPDYTPKYHTIHNTSMPSVKRVYQFSGLPSPYRTKIKPPSTNMRKVSGNSTIGSITTILEKSPSVKRPRSDAANTLLSILDGDDVKKHDSNSKSKSEVASFVNPYKSNNRKKRSKITANDINKTISYDRSEQLPETQQQKQPQQPQPQQPQTQSPQQPPPPSQQQQTQQNQDDFSKINGTLKKDNVSTNLKPIDTESIKENKNQFGFNFGHSTEPKLNQPIKQKPNDIKSNSNNEKPIDNDDNSSRSTASNSKTTENAETSINKFEFTFPTVETIEVTLDQEKVRKYASLFSF